MPWATAAFLESDLSKDDFKGVNTLLNVWNFFFFFQIQPRLIIIPLKQ